MPETKELSLPMLGTQLPNQWLVVAVHRTGPDEGVVLALRKHVAEDFPYCVWTLSLRDMSTYAGEYAQTLGYACAEFSTRAGVVA